MKKLLILLSLYIVTVYGRPEPPPPSPSQPSIEYGSPSPEPEKEYGTPHHPPPPPPPPPPSPQLPAPQKYLPPQQHHQAQIRPVYGPPLRPVYGPPPLERLVTKNIYVHVPPEEPVEWAPSQTIRLPPPKKHYKIIFIKAPVQPNPTVPQIPLQSQDEHKTLVYVLVKKPDEQPQINIPIPEPTEPSKPEVYFIRYKNGNKPSPEYGPPKGPY